MMMMMMMVVVVVVPSQIVRQSLNLKNYLRYIKVPLLRYPKCFYDFHQFST